MLKLTHGPHVGRISADSARIWLRLEKESYARIKYNTGSLFGESGIESELLEEFKNNCSTVGPQKAEKGNDYIVNFDLENNLDADTEYLYMIETSEDGNEYTEQSIAGRLFGYFKTFPNGDAIENEFVFAFGSCFHPFKKGDQIFQGMDIRSRKEKGIRFLLLIGDQVYADQMPKDKIAKGVGEWKRKGLLGKLKEALDFEAYKNVYHAFWDSYPFRQALMRIPTFMTFDDHEFRNGWGLKGENDPNSAAGKKVLGQRAGALKAYNLYQHALNPATQDNQYWYHFNYGNIGFFVLDTRTARDRRKKKKGIILDDTQMKALKHWLKDNNHTYSLKFIVSSVPIVHISSIVGIDIPKVFPEAGDQWPGFENQRIDLLNYIFDEGIKGVYFLSGDVHMSHAAKIDKKDQVNKVLSFTSSPVAMPSPVSHEYVALKDRIGEGLNVTPIFRGAGKNFGLVRVCPRKNFSGNDKHKYDVFCELYDKNAEKFFSFPGKAAVVLDVDRTISTSKVLKKNSIPYFNAAKVVRELHEKLTVVYLTARPKFLPYVGLVREWLRQNEFPASQIIMMMKPWNIFPSRHDNYKKDMIEHMIKRQLHTPVIGIGDRKTDDKAYRAHGMISIIIDTGSTEISEVSGHIVKPDPQTPIWDQIRDYIFDEITLDKVIQERKRLYDK